MSSLPLPVEDAHARNAEDVCQALSVDAARGLTPAEAAARLASFGANVLASVPPVPAWRRLLAQFESPLVLLLVVAGAISLVVWVIEREHELPYEAFAILAIVLANALLGFFQEERAEEAVASLRKMTAASATVVRGGERLTLAAADLVPGDLLVVEEGMTIPADARVVQSVSLQTNEAALTGESTPVHKDEGAVATDAGIADRTNMLFSGTAATYGHGLAVVTATGMRAEVGKIAGLLHETRAEQTPLQAQLDRVGKILGAVVIAIALIVAATILILQRDFSTAALVGVLLYAVALAVSAVPEGLAAVTTVVLSLGMQRMAKRKAIIRRLSAVETLGSANVICSDKTGTLTKNEMTVRALVTASGRVGFTGTGYAPEGELRAGDGPPSESLRKEAEWALATGLLDNNSTLSERAGRWTVLGDPTEGALKVAALKAGLSADALESRFARVGEIPFSAERKMMSTAHADREEATRAILMAKGAPDVLLARCTHERVGDRDQPLGPLRREAIAALIDQLAGEALRTLGLAYRPIALGAAQDLASDVEAELVWLGVIGMMDPPRPEAHEAVRVAQRAGIRVIMITGDHPALAVAIATELGIAEQGSGAIKGAELERMSDETLKQKVREVSVYARVAPEHKLRIVRALKANGAIVAMTGDGVNDAPALKTANIGVAMGITGTDVAKEAADMVLADDNFATIVAAIEEGRSIYSNIQKFLRYLLSTNLGEVLVMFFGVALASTIGLVAGEGEVLLLPLLATMILWINLVTDGFPALAVGVDPPDAGVMLRAPRAAGEGVITRRMWYGIGIASVVMCVGTLLLLDAGLPGGLIEGDGDIGYARTMAFNVLVLYQLFAVFGVRSDETSAARGLFSNVWLWLSVAFALVLQAAVIYIPALQKGFGTVALDAQDWLICTLVAATVLVAREILKAYWRRRDRRAAAA